MKQSTTQNLTSLVNYEDLEIVDYDNFMDENTQHHYSSKYSFLSDYKSSFKASFLAAKAFTDTTKQPVIAAKLKSSFESTTSTRTSSEICDIFREYLFTKSSLTGTIFEFITTHQNLLHLLSLQDFEEITPLLGLRIKELRRDALELDKDFSRTCSLETLKRVLYGKTAEKLTKDLIPELLGAYKGLFLKVLLEKGCLLFLKQSFFKLFSVKSELQTAENCCETLSSALKSLKKHNFEEIYDKPAGFRNKLHELKRQSEMFLAQMDKAKLFKSFLEQEKAGFSEQMRENSCDLLKVFEELAVCYEQFENKLKKSLPLVKTREFSQEFEELRTTLTQICENYLDKEKQWELLLQAAFEKVKEILLLEQRVKQLAAKAQKLVKINLFVRKAFSFAVERSANFVKKIDQMHEKLEEFSKNPVNTQSFADLGYGLEEITSQLSRILKEIKGFRRDKLRSHENFSVLYGLFLEIEEFYQELQGKVAFLRLKFKDAQSFLENKQGFQEMRQQAKEKGIFQRAEPTNSFEIDGFLQQLTLYSAVYQEAQCLMSSSRFSKEEAAENKLFLELCLQSLENLVLHFKGPDLKAIEAMNHDIKESKALFKELLNIKKLDEELEDEKFRALSQSLEKLIEKFREYKDIFLSNEELRDKCEKLYAELVKASNFLMNFYIERLGNQVLSRKNVVKIIDSLDINLPNAENLEFLLKMIRNIDFIEQNLEENFYHSSKKIALANKIQFVGLTLRLFHKNYEDLQSCCQRKSPDSFNHKEFFNQTITHFSSALKLDLLEHNKLSSLNYSGNNINKEGEGKDNNDFSKEDLIECFERYLQRNKAVFDVESQAFEYEKEKKNFLEIEEKAHSFVKELVAAGTRDMTAHAEKYEEIEGFIKKLKSFKKFFWNVVNVHQESWQYLSDVEKHVSSIDNWLRSLQLLSSSYKSLYKLKTLSLFSSEQEVLSAETLKKIKNAAQELFLLSSKTKKLINNEAINLLSKHASLIVEKVIEFLNLLYFNLASFLEFDLIFKENSYKFVLNQAEFLEAIELCLDFEGKFPDFLAKTSKIRNKELIEASEIDINIQRIHNEYKENVFMYLETLDLKVFKRMSGFLKYLSVKELENFSSECLNSQYFCSKSSNIVAALKEIYKKAQETLGIIENVENCREFLRKMEESGKYSKKRLGKIVGFYEFSKKFEEIRQWTSFLQKIVKFLEEYLLVKRNNEKEQGKITKETELQLKKMLAESEDLGQKEILKHISSLISKINK